MRLIGFVHGWEWDYIQVRNLVCVFVKKILAVAKAVSSNERRGPTTQISRNSPVEILTGMMSVFPRIFSF